MAKSEEQTSGADAAVLYLFIYGALYQCLHHIVAVVFHFGCLQHTYSQLKLLANCSDVITFDLKLLCKSQIHFSYAHKLSIYGL